MKIEAKPIDSILMYEFNNRIHKPEQIEMIADSIKEFGFNQPLVIDEKNVILVGHGRYLAAKTIGMETVPCLQLCNLTPQQKAAYRIIDNKLQNDSTWDFNNLELEIGSLEDEGWDIEFCGLDTLLPSDFSPVSLDEQSSLDEANPKIVKCPECGHDFDANKTKT